MAGMLCSLPTHCTCNSYQTRVCCWSCRGSSVNIKIVRDFDSFPMSMAILYEADGSQVLQVVQVSTTELTCEIEPRSS